MEFFGGLAMVLLSGPALVVAALVAAALAWGVRRHWDER